MISLVQEHADHTFGAQYDDIRERYASEIEYERWWYEYMQKVFEAGFGEDDDAYERDWSRTLDYYIKLGY